MRSIAFSAALCLAVLASPSAQADPTNPVIPSKQAIAEAQQQVTNAQGSVSSIEGQLVAADTELQNLGVAAGKASEAYDGAMYRYQLAQKAAVAAQKRADRSSLAATNSRNSLAGYVVSHETAGSQMSAIGTAMTATGARSLLNQLADYNTTSSALDARLQQWQATTRLARVYRAQAVAALADAATAKQQAEAAKAAAAAAVAQQQAAVSSIAAQKTSLIAQLAAAQHTSVQLAAQRSQGLEILRQQRLAEQRRQAALARQRAEARQQALEQQQRLEQQRQAQQRREQQQRQQQQQSPPSSPPSNPPSNPPEQPAEQPAVEPAEQPAVEPPEQPALEPALRWSVHSDRLRLRPARRALRLWGCRSGRVGLLRAHDGLVGRGRGLPAALRRRTVRVPPARLVLRAAARGPGVLGSSSDPSTIYHVALYIGNGQIIQAPHPGAYVEVSGIYDWILPNFYGRV